VGAVVFARPVGRDVEDLGVSGSDAGASSGGGSWANARLAQQKMSAKEPTRFGRDIDQLSRFGKIDGDDDKAPQYDTSVVTRPGNSDFFFRLRFGAQTFPEGLVLAENLTRRIEWVLFTRKRK
jgi:hypothetical protein